DCAPDRCSASKASYTAAAAVFEAAAAADVCVGQCTCAGKGPVCGSTFDPNCKLEPSTLYKCDGAGSTPTPGEVCGAGGCKVTNGDDECNPVDCTCPGSGTTPVCGFDLPKACGADPNTIYMCPGGSGTAPVPQQVCRPGTKCLKKDPPQGAVCSASGCECEGEEEVCSDDFDKECNLVPNSIYKCKDGTKVKQESCDATETCVTISNGAMCVSKDCKCPVDGTVCGQVFPLSCKLKATALYTCKKGGDPVFEKDCYPDRCSVSKTVTDGKAVFESPSSDVCQGQCTCAGKGDVCGSTFPPECNKDPDTLYKCDGGAGSEPTVGEKCKEGGCKVMHGSDKCATNKCTCPAPGTDPVCGADLPAECNAKKEEIYYCPGGTGTEPKVLAVCDPGTVCIKKDSPEGAVCGSPNCDCFGSNEVCSNQFPDKCGLEKNTIYKCSANGKPELVKKCDATQSCVAAGGDAHCVNNDCKCEKDGDVCGEVFPLSCKISTTAVYTCKKGEAPKLKSECYPGGRCDASADSFAAAAIFEALDAVCVSDCTCGGPGPACGHTFPDHCDLDKTTLYKCDGSGTKPTEIEKCKGGCLSSNGDDRCSTDICTCPSGTDPVCGADLPSACNAKVNTIYHCPGGSGTAPEPLSECLPGTMCIKKPSPEGAVCGSGTCDCKGDKEVCSNQFPDECGLEKNTVYKCTADGKPEKVKACKDTESCVSLGDEAVCANNDCKCPDDGTICGQAFPPSCKLKATALYTCTKGDNPILYKICDPERCTASKSYFTATAVFEANAAADVCTSQCLCAGKGPVCGSTFDPDCKLEPSTLYKCDGAGSTPTLIEVCGQGGCTVNNGDDNCNPST
ncbi:hypothetical protein BGX24_005781, partial [Mortierella sp. AD032]